MAEYIIKCPYGMNPVIDDGGEIKERIVRCMDCKNFDQSTSLFRLSGKCLSERFFACKVKPNGFCAWGEAKVVE